MDQDMSEIKMGLRFEAALKLDQSGSGVWRRGWADHAEAEAKITVRLRSGGLGLFINRNGHQELPWNVTHDDLTSSDWCVWA